MRTPAARLSVFTAASFAVLGIWLPFWPAWLEGRGMTPVQIGALALAWAWTRGLATPFWAHFVDRSGRRRIWLASLSLAALVAFAPFVMLDTFTRLLCLTVLFCLAHAPVLPLGENLIVLHARERGLSYGAVRLWGSVAFVVANWVGGFVLDHGHAERAWLLMMVCLAAGAASAWWLPDESHEHVAAPMGWPILRVLAVPRVLAALAGAGIVQAAHATYYVFSTLHWKAAGHSTTTIGFLWSEGVIAEVLLFAAASRLVRRFGDSGLMLAAVIGSAVRWAALATTTDLTVLIAVQWMHALSFSAAHASIMAFLTRAVPREHSASAISVYGTINIAAHGLVLLGVSPLFERSGGVAFWPMIALAVIGGSIAIWGMRGHRDVVPQAA